MPETVPYLECVMTVKAIVTLSCLIAFGSSGTSAAAIQIGWLLQSHGVIKS